MTRFVLDGKHYVQCGGCKRVAPDENWAHVHGRDRHGKEIGQNWYRSVAELRAALRKSALPPGTIVKGFKT
jgi:hypothetical protein